MKPFFSALRSLWQVPTEAPDSLQTAFAALGYQLGEELGQGGMGVVYRALRPAGEGECAVKLLHAELGLDWTAVQRMRREIAILRSLRHRNIVQMYACGEVLGQQFLSMELVRGETLRVRLQERQTPLPRALGYVRQLLSAIEYAHSQDVIHRDLKPENVMIREDESLCILDFGVSRSLRDRTLVTVGDSVVGTPAYMAPERFSGLATQWTDQYAIGLMAYELVTGGTPFGDEADTGSLITRQLLATPRPPSYADPALPEWLDAFILRMLQKDPRQRFASLSEAGQHLAGQCA